MRLLKGLLWKLIVAIMMHWNTEIALWCEMLLGRRVDFGGMHQNFYDGCFVVTLCAALENRPSDGDIAALGVLVERSLGWDGPRGMLLMECTGRRRNKCDKIRFARETEEIYSLRHRDRLRWCVRVSPVHRFFSARSYPRQGEDAKYFVDLFMFSPIRTTHMELFIAVERQNERTGCHVALFRPLLAVLYRSESFVVPFRSEGALGRMMDPSTWLELVRVVWPDAEQIAVDESMRLSNDQNTTINSLLVRAGFFGAVPTSPPIIVAQGEAGLFVTIDQRGCVLLAAGVRPRID